GTGDTRINLLVESLAAGLYLIYCYLVIFHYRMPLAFAWGSEFLYWLVILISSSLFLRSKRWHSRKI
ncbi:MAG: hypothetical protein ACYCOO_09400, partial [Chitinophagaceae bacterium]